MTTVSVHEAKTHLSRLIARALDGEEIVITRGKERVIQLTPLRKEPIGRRIGLLKGKITFDNSFFDPLPDDELALWNGEGD